MLLALQSFRNLLFYHVNINFPCTKLIYLLWKINVTLYKLNDIKLLILLFIIIVVVIVTVTAAIGMGFRVKIAVAVITIIITVVVLVGLALLVVIRKKDSR